MHDLRAISSAATAPADTASDAPPAVRLHNVSKSYRLYDRPSDRLIDQLGINRLMFWKQQAVNYHLFHALKNVDFSIGKGERIGIIGRNGAGKTTLLKLITGNFMPSEGVVEINGTVQALMQLGIGFHQEFSGYENIKAALHYNGLIGAEFDAALEDVVDFVELGEFLHQPMKTYSLGMNARVQFATATAIKPDILIIDEVLGAGDAYFSAKSAYRMEQLTSSGCTLLLVSHSSAQILQFCKRCIFLHEGRMREDGSALEVVKHYEEFIAELTHREKNRQVSAISDISSATAYLENSGSVPMASTEQADYRTPQWQQAQLAVLLQDQPAIESSVAQKRISRWVGEPGLKIKRVEVFNESGLRAVILQAGRACAIEVEIVAEKDGDFSARVAILIMTLTGVGVVRHLSDEITLSLKKDETRVIRLTYDRLALAQGQFVFSAALFKVYDPDDTSTAVRYDLLSRSFAINVVPVRRSEPALVNLPCRWVHEAPAL